MISTNRRWQEHLRSKGAIAFFLDRLKSHALSSQWQFSSNAFDFPMTDRDRDDELSRAFFELSEHFPYELFIEITNSCNLECKMCARSAMTRSQGIMSNDLFEKIVDEIAEKQPYACLHYYGIGESLLDKQLFEKLEYANNKELYNSIIFSNGQLLMQDENYKRLVDSGVAIIGVDLDGFSPEAYEQIRIGGSFECAKEGIERLYSYVRQRKLKTRIELAYQVYSGINDHDIAPFIDWCNDNAYEYKLVTLHNWVGLRDSVPVSEVEGVPDQHHEKRTCPCCALWSGFTIAWDGRVALCFQDADVREVLGDVSCQTIEEVWKGKYLEKRREHVRGVFGGLCKTCDSYTAVRLPGKESSIYPQSLR